MENKLGEVNEQQLNYLGKKLKRLFAEKEITPKEVSAQATFSYQQLNHLMHGRRIITLEALRDLGKALNLSPEEIAMLVITSDTPQHDEAGTKKINALIPHRSDEKKGKRGALLFLSESVLKEKYADYDSKRLMYFAAQYINDTYLNERFAELDAEEKREREISDALVLKTDNQPMREIIEMLFELEQKELLYIKEHLRIYMRHHGK